jgi:hypothetical protein
VRGRLGRAGHALGIAVVAAAVVYLFAALLEPTAFYSHENLFVYHRADQVAREFRAGHLPQVFPDAVGGAGFAFPRFYPPLSLWLSAWMSMLVGDTSLGVNLTFLLSVLASGLAMYFCVVSILGDRWLAVAASLVYVSTPYRFVDVFVRGALAEAWTFAWYPIVVAGLWHAAARRTFKWYLPVGVAALLVSHNITALYFLGFCSLFCALAVVWHGWRGALLPVAALGLGLGLGAWFLLPQQVYMRDVWVSDPAFMWADADHVQGHRVLPWQFFYSLPGRRWYGESYGPDSTDHMSFELGVGQLAALVVVLLAVRRVRATGRRGSRRLAAVGWTAVAAWGASLLFMLWPHAFLWPLPRQFAYVQFPWRLLALATFLASLALAVFAYRARLGERGRWALVAASVAIVLLVPGFEREMKIDPELHTDATVLEADYVRQQGTLGFTVLAEYLPRDFDVTALREGRLDAALFEAPRVEAGEGAAIRSWDRRGLDFDVTLEAPVATTVALPLVYYDCYRVEADGREVETFSSAGFLAVHVPAGSERLEVRQRVTPVYVLGFGASALAAVAIAAVAVALRRRRSQAPALPYANPKTALE